MERDAVRLGLAEDTGVAAIALAEGTFRNNAAAAVVNIIFGFPVAAIGARPWASACAQQCAAQPATSMEALIGQSALMPCPGIGHPPAQAVEIPGAQGSPAKPGCVASKSIARIAMNWKSRFISANNHSGDGHGGL